VPAATPGLNRRPSSQIFFVTREKICDTRFYFRIDFIPQKVIARPLIDIDIFRFADDFPFLGIAGISLLKSVNFPVESGT